MKRDDLVWGLFGVAFVIIEYRVGELSPVLRRWLGVHPRGKRYPYAIGGYLLGLLWLARHITTTPKGIDHVERSRDS